MYHALGMGKSHRFADAKENPQHIGLGHPAGKVLQPLAPNQLHHVIDPTVGQRPDLVNGDDARMLEPRANPRLALEPDGRFVGGHVRAEHLERHLPGQGPVERTVHRPHPAMPDRLAVRRRRSDRQPPSDRRFRSADTLARQHWFRSPC